MRTSLPILFTLIGSGAALAEQTAVPVDLLVHGQERPLPRRLETGIYRLVQEALQNVSLHAQARRAVVELGFEPFEVRLVVADDGLGFDPTAVSSDRIGMNERVRLLNGRFHLQSAPGEGTRIEAILPV